MKLHTILLVILAALHIYILVIKQNSTFLNGSCFNIFLWKDASVVVVPWGRSFKVHSLRRREEDR